MNKQAAVIKLEKLINEGQAIIDEQSQVIKHLEDRDRRSAEEIKRLQYLRGIDFLRALPPLIAATKGEQRREMLEWQGVGASEAALEYITGQPKGESE